MSIRPHDIIQWKQGHDLLAISERTGTSLSLRNIRDFTYFSDDRLRNRTYFDDYFDTSAVCSVTVFVVPFSQGSLLAHTILSFHFDDERTLALSVEARQRSDEDYSILKWIFPHYGLIYIWGTERDLVGLRLYSRRDQIDAYRLCFDRDTCRKLLESCLSRTESLLQTPETYGILSNNCTTNLVRHIADVLDIRYPILDYRVILSGRIARFFRAKEWVVSSQRIPYRACVDESGEIISDKEFARLIREGD